MTMEKERVNLRKISQDFPKMAARSNILSTKEISTRGIKPVSPNKWIRLNPDFFPKIQTKDRTFEGVEVGYKTKLNSSPDGFEDHHLTGLETSQIVKPEWYAIRILTVSPTCLQTDASYYGMGANPFQIQKG